MRTKEAVVSCMFKQTNLSHLLVYTIFDICTILFDQFKLDSVNKYPSENPKIEIMRRKYV